MAKNKLKQIKRICFVSREYDGLAGAGGVKDVCRQLAEALSSLARITVILPCYGFMDPKALGFKERAKFVVDMSYPDQPRQEKIKVWAKRQVINKGQIDIYLIDSPRFAEKQGVYAYTEQEAATSPFIETGGGHIDYFAMNVLLQKAAICYLIHRNERPDIIHCHDGHTALIPAMVRETDGYRHFFKQSGFLVTIHNAGIGYHQEIADLPFAQAITGLPANFINKNLLDGKFDPFIASANHAIMNTVSENYARELRQTDDDALTGWLGHFLMSRGIKLRGITNGISPEEFDPTKAEALGLPAAFTINKGDMAGKKTCRQQLLKQINNRQFPKVKVFGKLTNKQDQPLLTLIGRFSAQKGVDKLVEALHFLLPRDPDFQVLILGSGDERIARGLAALTSNPKFKNRICVLQGYDPQLAIKIYAAGDFFIIPSRFEPCGLTDYIAQLFGNLPIVHAIGGLVKVIDQKTGFSYTEHNSQELAQAISRACQTYRHQPAKILTMQKDSLKIINKKYTWNKVMKKYLELYEEALPR